LDLLLLRYHAIQEPQRRDGVSFGIVGTNKILSDKLFVSILKWTSLLVYDVVEVHSVHHTERFPCNSNMLELLREDTNVKPCNDEPCYIASSYEFVNVLGEFLEGTQVFRMLRLIATLLESYWVRGLGTPHANRAIPIPKVTGWKHSDLLVREDFDERHGENVWRWALGWIKGGGFKVKGDERRVRTGSLVMKDSMDSLRWPPISWALVSRRY
jgi:hypothetical protein